MMKTPQSTSLRERLDSRTRVRSDEIMQTFEGEFDSNTQCLEWLAKELDIQLLHMGDLLKCKSRFDLISFLESSRVRCTSIEDSSGVKLIMTDPFDVDRYAWAQTLLGPHQIAIVARDTYDAWLAHCEAANT